MPVYQKNPTRVYAFQAGGADDQDWGDIGTVDGSDWVIKAADGSITIMTDANFIAKYTVVTSDQALTGTDIT